MVGITYLFIETIFMFYGHVALSSAFTLLHCLAGYLRLSGHMCYFGCLVCMWFMFWYIYLFTQLSMSHMEWRSRNTIIKTGIIIIIIKLATTEYVVGFKMMMCYQI